jgi:predicted small secreted protein
MPRGSIEMGVSRVKAVSVALSLVVAGTLLTGCSSTRGKCDDLLNALSFGAWSESDSDWYDANCRE